MSDHPALQIQGLQKSFDQHTALSDINLQLPAGEVLALLGPSGCGKTTLLRCIAGLHQPDQGQIFLQGQKVVDGGWGLPPEQRLLGMVFQDYALWPHLKVAENLAFPLQMQGLGKAERQQKIDWALDLVGLRDRAESAPGTLSGGQQQRVALARAIVNQPRLLLMDEPLSNLDKGLRENLALDIRRLIDELHLTAVFVTHDQQEAYALADRIAVLNQGRIQQLATPEELYRHPATPDIARFLDAGSLIEAECTPQGLILAGQPPLPLLAKGQQQGRCLLLIPRRALKPGAPKPDTPQIAAELVSCIYHGEHYACQAQLADGQRLRFSTQHRLVTGQLLNFQLDTSALLAWTLQQQPLSLVAFSPTLD